MSSTNETNSSHIMSSTNETNSSCPPKNYGLKATLAQTLATMAQSFLLIRLGMELSISLIVIRDLYQNPNKEFPLTVTEVSWYGSLIFIFYPTGSFVSGFLQDRFGRKTCMIFANIPSVIGWIVLYFANSSVLLIVSTILMGLSLGFSSAPRISYLGEIAEPKLRGTLTSLSNAAPMFGRLLIFVLGFFYTWRTVALLSTLCPIICICLLFFVPESPTWLVSKEKNDKAERALCWLRGWVKPEETNAEYVELIRYHQVSGIRGDVIDSEHKGIFSKLAQFKDPLLYRPLNLVMMYFVISNIVCIVPARPFITKIMADVGLADIQNLLLIIFAIMQSVGSVILTLTVRHLGKRCLTMFTLSANTISTFLFSAYIIAVKKSYVNSMPWIPLILICGIFFFGACGITSIPWMLLSEVFPNKRRGLGTGTCAGLTNLILFVLTKSYLTMEKILTLEYTLVLFGFIGIFGLIYLYLYLPETENKTLLEIEEHFASN